MKKFFHYFICAFNLIIKTINAVFRKVRNGFFVFFRLFKCAYLICKRDTLSPPKHDLSHYYTDPGKLSETKGYKHKNTKYDLSIIIPVYNVEKYIEECLNSVISQKTEYKYEVILVNDGSTDNTPSIVKPYLADNVKLINQENSGQSVARNNALYESSGKYIMFVDGDDILLPGAIQNLMDAVIKNTADISEGNVVWLYGAVTEDMLNDCKTKPHIESYERNPKFVLTCNGYSFAKVYRRELFESLRFPEGYIFEDVITKFILRRKANKVVFAGIPVYAYRYNNQSSSHGSISLKKLDSIWVYSRIVKLCLQENAPFDDIFYLLSLNHIGILDYITLKNQNECIKLACFNEMRAQLLSIKDYRTKGIPLFFKLIKKSILDNNIAAWLYIAETINKYQLLKKWREIN